MEALKLVAGLGEPPLGRLTYYQALTTRFRELKLKANPDCPLCGTNPTITSPIDYSTPTAMNEISITDLANALGENPDAITLIDVREQDEWDQAHLPEATLLPLSQWPAIAEERLPKEGTYHLLCAGGVRSARAAVWLEQNGYQNTTNIAGGMNAWLAAGLPTQP